MANALDNLLVLEEDAVLVFRNFVSGTNRLVVRYTAVDPNGVVSAPQGSLASGPEGCWVNADGATSWLPVLTTDVFALPPDTFYIDQTASSQAAMFRIYPTISAAVTAAEADPYFAGNVPYILRLREGQTHAWPSGAGLPAGSGRRVTITCRGKSQAELLLSGNFPTSTGGVLEISMVRVLLSGNVSTAQGRQVLFDEVDFVGGGNVLTCATLLVQRSSWSDVYAAGAPTFLGPSLTFALFIDSTLSWSSSPAPMFASVGLLTFSSCTVRVSASDFSFMTPVSFLGSSAASVAISDSDFSVDQSGAGTASLFSVGSGSIQILNSKFTFDYSGGGTIDFGISNLTGGSGGAADGPSFDAFGVVPTYLPSGARYDFELAGDVLQIQDFQLNPMTLSSTPGISLSKATVSATGGASLSFIPATTWPADGYIDIMFPADFDVSGAQLAANSGADGVIAGFSTFTSALATFLTNGAFGTDTNLDAPNNQYTLVLSAGGNPANHGSYLIASVSSETSLTTSAVFPVAPEVGPYTYNIIPYFGVDGGFSVTVSGQVVRISRDNTGTPVAPGTKCAIALRGIVNPGDTGSTDDFLVVAFSGAPQNGQQDTGTASGVLIT